MSTELSCLGDAAQALLLLLLLPPLLPLLLLLPPLLLLLPPLVLVLELVLTAEVDGAGGAANAAGGGRIHQICVAWCQIVFWYFLLVLPQYFDLLLFHLGIVCNT